MMKLSKSKSDLHTATRIRCNATMAAMRAYGYPIFIVRTYDTLTKQEKLYAQGRTTPGKIVTKIKKGWHNIRQDGKPCARAIDWAFCEQEQFPNRDSWSMDWPWDRLKKIAEACDLKKTLKWDYGHFVDKQGEKFKEAWRNSDQC
jgi:peptidoglycan L-alanyl-D-glutamate endopeptidase CwlK